VQVGDLVEITRVPESILWGRLGIVVELHNRVVPTAVVRWHGVEGTMAHRIKMLKVINASR
jgi:hypothetical protein